MSETIKPAPIIALPNVPVTRVRHRRQRAVWSVLQLRNVTIPAEAVTTRSGEQVRDDRQGDW